MQILGTIVLVLGTPGSLISVQISVKKVFFLYLLLEDIAEIIFSIDKLFESGPKVTYLGNFVINDQY